MSHEVALTALSCGGIRTSAPHDFTANVVFDEHGLDPRFGTDSQVTTGGGSKTGRLAHERFERAGLVGCHIVGVPTSTGGHVHLAMHALSGMTKGHNVDLTGA